MGRLRRPLTSRAAEPALVTSWSKGVYALDDADHRMGLWLALQARAPPIRTGEPAEVDSPPFQSIT